MTRAMILTSVLLIACGGDPGRSTGDGGLAEDGAVEVDAPFDASASQDATPLDPVARCRALALELSETCNGQADRTCEWTERAELCAEQDAAALVPAMQCLLDGSLGTDGCRTFGDPSGTAPCLHDALAGAASAEERAVAETIVALCPGATVEHVLERTIVPVSVLRSAAVTRISACLSGANSCDEASDCLLPEISSVLACYEP